MIRSFSSTCHHAEAGRLQRAAPRCSRPSRRRPARHAAAASARSPSCRRGRPRGPRCSRVVALDDVDVLVDGVGRARVPHASPRRAGSPAGCRSSRCARGGGSSSRAADGGSGCAPCTGSRPPMRRMPEFSAFDSAKSMMRDLAAEIDRGLGALVGQLHQPAAASAGQDIGHGRACQRCVVGFCHGRFLVLACGTRGLSLRHLEPDAVLPSSSGRETCGTGSTRVC